jgi:hypothetical protein
LEELPIRSQPLARARIRLFLSEREPLGRLSAVGLSFKAIVAFVLTALTVD